MIRANTIEEQNTDEYSFGSAWNRMSGGLGFSSCNSNTFNSRIGV